MPSPISFSSLLNIQAKIYAEVISRAAELITTVSGVQFRETHGALLRKTQIVKKGKHV